MNLSARTKAVGYLVAVFLAGLVAGLAVGYSVTRQPFFKPPAPSRLTARIVAHLKSELSLNGEQVRQVTPWAGQAAEQIHAVHCGGIEQIRQISRNTHRQIEPLLTPEQRIRLAELERKQDAHFQRMGSAKPERP